MSPAKTTTAGVTSSLSKVAALHNAWRLCRQGQTTPVSTQLDTVSAGATAKGVLSSNHTAAALHTIQQTHKPAHQETSHCPFGARSVRLHQISHRLMLSDMLSHMLSHMLSAGATATGVPSSHHKAAALHTAPASWQTHECANQETGHCPLQACSNRTDECRGSPSGDPRPSGVAGRPRGAAVLCDCAKR